MGWFGKKKPETVTHTQTFELKGPTRLVRDDVLTIMDDALATASGTEVMHAIDPGRIITFADGGPPIWSVGVTEVRDYTLFLTYGFSHILSPEPDREGIAYEFSIAIPKRCQSMPWAVALLRHLSRYQLGSGNELMVGDVMPCNAPITCVPFPVEHHAAMPPTQLDSIVIVSDPVLGQIPTPHGTIEVRRIVGVPEAYLHEIGPQPPPQRSAMLRVANPQLLTDIGA